MKFHRYAVTPTLDPVLKLDLHVFKLTIDIFIGVFAFLLLIQILIGNIQLMKNAFIELGLNSEAISLLPNCLYYKFVPHTIEEVHELLALEGEKIYIEDYPLEYEVIEYGAFYKDKEAIDTIIKPYYILAYDGIDINIGIEHYLL